MKKKFFLNFHSGSESTNTAVFPPGKKIKTLVPTFRQVYTLKKFYGSSMKHLVFSMFGINTIHPYEFVRQRKILNFTLTLSFCPK